MTDPAALADQQQRQVITAPAPLFIRACPGAGKTHVVVSRHLAAPAPLLRQGRALLSFTRAATNQMRRRCLAEGRPDTTGFPHYIGTLDSFIWEILAAPRLPADRPWRLLNSWDRVDAPVKLDREVQLGSLPFTYDPGSDTETLRWDLLDPAIERTLSRSEHPRARWETKAREIRQVLTRRGYLTGHETRITALRRLRTHGKTILDPLASRFAEIVIDEAQDCSITDLAILEHLHAAGLPLVVVADPDQMIYGWRDADPRRLAALTSTLGRTVTLTGNRRSTVTICRLAATLRTNRHPDLSVAHHVAAPPILIMPTRFSPRRPPVHVPTGRDLIEVFCEQAAAHGISATNCLVTAQWRATLPGTVKRAGGNATARLARAWHILHSGTGDPDRLDHACRVAARLLLRYWYPDTMNGSSIEAVCEYHQLPLRDLMRHAYAFLHTLPSPHSAWTGQVNQHLKSWPRPATARPRGTVGQLRGTVGKGMVVAATEVQLRIDNVHQVKGEEHDAVLLLLPDDDVFTRWRDNNPAADETLRIWYVAATRARRLAALACPEHQLDGIRTLLTAHGVTHQLQ